MENTITVHNDIEGYHCVVFLDDTHKNYIAGKKDPRNPDLTRIEYRSHGRILAVVDNVSKSVAPDWICDLIRDAGLRKKTIKPMEPLDMEGGTIL